MGLGESVVRRSGGSTPVQCQCHDSSLLKPDLTWHYETGAHDGHTIITLTGEIDRRGRDTARRPAEGVAHHEAVTVDIAGVGFIDSTVISALVAARAPLRWPIGRSGRVDR